MFSFFKSKSNDFFFGKYQKPTILKELEEFQSKGISWEYLGFFIEYDHFYSQTPIDVIPFAGTGGNGIHFGFLTDFGNASDLENAPIVCISPSGEPGMKLVAKNLADFLGIVSTIGYAEFLDEEYCTEQEVKTRLEDWDAISEVDWQGNPIPKSELEESKERLSETLFEREKLRNILKSEFGINSMANILEYFEMIKFERLKEVAFQDCYEVGVCIDNYVDENLTNFDFENKDLSSINSFLVNSTLSDRILFYRNATYRYVLSDDYDKEIKDVLIDALHKDGFRRESKILSEKY